MNIEKAEMTVTYHERLSQWMDRVVRLGPVPNETEPDELDEIDLSKLSEKHLVNLRVDLDGIYDSSRDLHHMLSQLPDDDASSDHFTDIVAEVDSHIKHIKYHWKDLKKTLRKNNMG